tara:strand:- start:110 stop:373 length:264 start_codon:yes stop_codon:yes gene_type:complete
MIDLYNKENLFAEFAMQKTNADKVKFLQDMKQLKRERPSMFRNTEITQKNFDNLIAEWSKPQPWKEINQQIKESRKNQDEVEAVNKL